MYEHYSYKKDVWTEFINGIVGMNAVYTLELCSRAKTIVHALNTINKLPIHTDTLQLPLSKFAQHLLKFWSELQIALQNNKTFECYMKWTNIKTTSSK